MKRHPVIPAVIHRAPGSGHPAKVGSRRPGALLFLLRRSYSRIPAVPLNHSPSPPPPQTNHTVKTNLLIPFSLLAATAAAFAQGPLNPPPGAPAPVMKSLDQVEARTPLVAGQPGVSIDVNGTITISQPGSYYLTGNRTITTAESNGITITTRNVNLDLNGFALICTSVDGGSAVHIGAGDVTVRNGSIRGGTTLAGSTFTLAGWGSGISVGASYPNLVAEGVSVSGVRTAGISLYYNCSRIERCFVHTVAGSGLSASMISNSSATKVATSAIHSAMENGSGGLVSNCLGEALLANYHGIWADGGNIENSKGTSNGGIGLFAHNATNSVGISGTWTGLHATTAMNCTGTSTSGTGLRAVLATNCRGTSTSGLGIFATNATNCLGMSTNGTLGMDVSGTASSCMGYSAAGGTAIKSAIAIGCTTLGGTISAPQKHLGTP